MHRSLLLLTVTLALLPSCATSHTRYTPGAQVPGTFTGTRWHVSSIGPKYEQASDTPPTLRVYERLIELGLDLPLSLTTDVLTAPLYWLGNLDEDTRRKRRELFERTRGMTAYEIAGEAVPIPSPVAAGPSPVAPHPAGDAPVGGRSLADRVRGRAPAPGPASPTAASPTPRSGTDDWWSRKFVTDGYFSATRTVVPIWTSWADSDGIGSQLWNSYPASSDADRYLVSTVVLPVAFATSTAAVPVSLAADVVAAPFQFLIETFAL